MPSNIQYFNKYIKDCITNMIYNITFYIECVKDNKYICVDKTSNVKFYASAELKKYINELVVDDIYTVYITIADIKETIFKDKNGNDKKKIIFTLSFKDMESYDDETNEEDIVSNNNVSDEEDIASDNNISDKEANESLIRVTPATNNLPMKIYIASHNVEIYYNGKKIN